MQSRSESAYSFTLTVLDRICRIRISSRSRNHIICKTLFFLQIRGLGGTQHPTPAPSTSTQHPLLHAFNYYHYKYLIPCSKLTSTFSTVILASTHSIQCFSTPAAQNLFTDHIELLDVCIKCASWGSRPEFESQWLKSLFFLTDLCPLPVCWNLAASL